MKQYSIWKEDIKPLPKSKEQYQEQDVDILIIGGGIAGMTAFYQLSSTDQNVLLIDKGQIGMGVTSNTTGKLTYLQDQIYEQIINTYNPETALQYLHAQKDAIHFVKQTVEKEKIDCNFEMVDSYVFAEKEKDCKKLNTLASFLEYAGIPYHKSEKAPLDLPSVSCISVSDTAVFHPLKYLYHLAHISKKKNKKIMEYVRATDIDQDGNFYIIHTDHFKIRAKKVLICTHYPFFVQPGWIPIKSHIESSYVLASKTKETKKISMITIQPPTISIRYHKDKENYLLFAGESVKKATCKPAIDSFQQLEEKFHELFKGNIEFEYTTHDIMPNDHLPFIGPISKKHPNVMIATGFQKWGMTNGTIAGITLADLALGKKAKYQDLFLPYRSYNFKRCVQTVVDGCYNMEAYVKSMFKKPTGRAKIIVKDGKKYGVCQDENSIHHYISIICPHMKCHLLFNEKETTWDCPCHGSRFDIDGNLIQGPSVFDVKKETKK